MSSYKRFVIQIESNIEFEAFVATKEAYRIEKDFGGLYEDMFKDIINGEFSIEYIERASYDKSRPDIQNLKIHSDNAIENIQEFCKHAKRLFGYEAILEDSNIKQLFSFRFVGSDFALKEGAEPQAYRKANDCFCSVLSILSSNNTSFGSPFMREQAGSIKLIADSTQKDEQSLDLLEKIITDIEKKEIDKDFIFNNIDGAKYKKAIEYIADVLKAKNLNFIEVDIQDKLHKIESGSYLSQSLKRIYGDYLEIKCRLYSLGTIGLDDGETIRFEVKSDSGKIWTCHANNKRIVKDINDNTVRRQFSIKGTQKAPETIEINKIELIKPSDSINP